MHIEQVEIVQHIIANFAIFLVKFVLVIFLILKEYQAKREE